MGARVARLRRSRIGRWDMTAVSLGILASLLLSACDIPRAMRVRAGVDPDRQDDFVRFRTTYYFRVFDACYAPQRSSVGTANWRDDNVFGGKKDGPFNLQSDSLYRFHMTGKAAALFTKIHFEAGTLRKEQIDPFGSAISFDRQSNRFSFQSQDETKREVQRSKDQEELNRLLNLRRQSELTPANRERIDAAIGRLIDRQADLATAPAVPVSPAQQVIQTDAIAKRAAELIAAFTVKGLIVDESKAISDSANKLLSDAATSFASQYSPNISKLWPTPASTAALSIAADDLKKKTEDMKPSNAPETVRTAVTKAQAAAATLATNALSFFSTKYNQSTLDAALAAPIQNYDAFESEHAKLVAFRTSVTRLLNQAQNAASTADVADKEIKKWQGDKTLSTAAQAARVAGVDAEEKAVAVQKILTDTVSSLEGLARAAKAAKSASEMAPAAANMVGNNKPITSWSTAISTAKNKASTFESSAANAAKLAVDAKANPSSSRTAAVDSAKAAGGAGFEFADSLNAANAAADDVYAQLYALSLVGTATGQALSSFPDNQISDSNLLKDVRARSTLLNQNLSRHLQTVSDAAATGLQLSTVAGTLEAAALPAVTSDPRLCPDGRAAQRGFQILGPQGWRTFDPDERLIMAMSSSAKPLVSMLQELSGRVLASQPNQSDILLPLVQERLKISETRRQLDSSLQGTPPADPAGIIKSVIETFEPESQLEGNKQ